MLNITGLPNGPLSSGSNASNSTNSPSTPLGIVPEKALLAHQIRRTVPAQYWGVSLATASSADGALAASVSVPAPLPLLAGSGLSRPHLVLATQALKLPGRPSLPGLPSVCDDQGGVVLDRVVAHGRGDSWWAVLSGRARLGRLIAQRADLAAAAVDPASYSLCATSRVQLSRRTVLRSRLDWCPSAPTLASPLLARRRAERGEQHPHGGTANPSSSSPAAGGRAAGWAAATPPLSLSCQMQSRVGRWAEVRADLAVCQRTAGGGTPSARGKREGAGGRLAATAASTASVSAAVDLEELRPGGASGVSEWAGAGVVTPLLLGLQAGSVVTSRAPLVWRCGVLQVTAPPLVPLVRAGGGGTTDAAVGAVTGPAFQSALYAQGTAALQGERVLWQAPKRPLCHRRRRRAESVSGATPAAAAAEGGGSSTTAAARPVLQPVARAVAPGPLIPTRKAAPGYHFSNPRGDNEDDNEDEGVVASPSGSAAAGIVPSGGGSETAGRALRLSRTAGASGTAGGGGAAAVGLSGGGGGGSSTTATAARPFGIELPTPGAVQDALIGATQSFSRLRDDVTSATMWVSSGGLVEQLGAMAPGMESKQQPQAAAAAAVAQSVTDGAVALIPWSSFVGEPHVKVAGVAGITARAPLIVLTHGSTSPGGGAAAALRPLRLAWVQDLGLSHVLHRRGHARGGTAAAGGGLTEDGFEAGGGETVSAARGSLRPFASAAASFQGGRFSRWLLDFTRVSAQLDCGLWGPDAVKSPAGDAVGGTHTPARQRHPAFALGDTGAWHALSLSLSQQLVGPLRFAADWRYQLASSRPLAFPPASPRSPLPSSSLSPSSSSPAALAPARAAAGVAAAAAGSWLGGAAGALAAHTAEMRPQLLDAVYALDLAVPGSRGAARMVAWYSPQRREGMIELRMF